MRVNSLTTRDAQSLACQQLNKRKPEFPPNVYFIRRNPQMLQKYLDPIEADNLVKDASPEYKKQYKIFQLSKDDANLLKVETKREREVSPHDPFLKEKPKFTALHHKVHGTNDLLDKLEPYESRHMTNQETLKQICDQETRFYKDNQQQEEEKIQNKLKKAGDETACREEATKLARLKKDVGVSKELTEIAPQVDFFERMTNNEFNYKMNIESSAHTTIGVGQPKKSEFSIFSPQQSFRATGGRNSFVASEMGKSMAYNMRGSGRMSNEPSAITLTNLSQGSNYNAFRSFANDSLPSTFAKNSISHRNDPSFGTHQGHKESKYENFRFKNRNTKALSPIDKEFRNTLFSPKRTSARGISTNTGLHLKKQLAQPKNGSITLRYKQQASAQKQKVGQDIISSSVTMHDDKAASVNTQVVDKSRIVSQSTDHDLPPPVPHAVDAHTPMMVIEQKESV